MVGLQLMLDALGSSVMVGLHRWLACIDGWMAIDGECSWELCDGWFALMVGL